jgi:hypothetical protein
LLTGGTEHRFLAAESYLVLLALAPQWALPWLLALLFLLQGWLGDSSSIEFGFLPRGVVTMGAGGGGMGAGKGVLGRGLQTEWVVVGEERVYGIGDGTGILVFFPICTGGGAVQVGEMESGVIGMAHPGEKERDQKVREGLRKGIANRIFLISCLI